MAPNIKTLLIPAAAIIGVIALALSEARTTTAAAYRLEREPEVIAATFSSEWCASCKILEPRLAKIMPEFAGQPVKFIDLDFTYGERRELAEAAAADGLADIYPRFKGATGFTLLVDRDTGDILDSLTVNYDAEAMRAAIARALAVAEQSKPAQSSAHGG